ncbi:MULTISPECIES: hypothetical protein [unclassified Corallococcus]|uniref:hypothetical protein n=1 Tax=unclassified Corallococcus TaxID=2685029 RepID=UPI001A907BDB|nr:MULTISPECIES: hypothetical protein [unclassified Corallococcus]MBN9685656.1 hypothetical protein [Corallococcus sp. NCSPR001]WAS82898.1 hypothetical protein O0N60_26665 [Corallococcus sp. NCRR]
MPRLRSPSFSSPSPSRSPSPSGSGGGVTPTRSPSLPPQTQASASSSTKRPRDDADTFDAGASKRPRRAAATGEKPPSAAELYQQQNAVGLQDTHSARTGDMSSLRTTQDTPEDGLNLLAHVGSQAKDKKGLFFEGPVERRGLGPQQVLTSVPDRDKGEHTNVFRGMTGGEPSSTKYQKKIGTADGDTPYEILHGMGHGEGGKQTQTPQNLASASHGANTAMIPADKAISGNPNILVDTRFNVRPGTQRAESVDQTFFHKDRPTEPIYQKRIDGDLPKVTTSQYKQLQQEAEYLKDRDALDAAVQLLNLKDGGKG